jgi:glycerol-3-phosphate dehydrogenase subunit C
MNDTRFESCIKCTVCTTSCPVSRVNPRYPGPKQAGPDGERLRLKDGALYDEALNTALTASAVKSPALGCKNWRYYPAGAGTVRPAKADAARCYPQPYRPDGHPLHAVCPAGQRRHRAQTGTPLLDATLKIDHRRTLPKYGFGTFRRAYRQLAARQAQYSEQVAFFHGCYVNYNHPQLGKDLIRVLNAMGTGVQLLAKKNAAACR